MTPKGTVSLVLLTLLATLPRMGRCQIDPGVMPVRIFEILDPSGLRLGIVLVAGREDRGYKAGFEAWRFRERVLLEMAELDSLSFVVWGEGEWDEPWVVEALAWQPLDPVVEWSHPAAVDWMPANEVRPPEMPSGTHFGDATLGGLSISYSPRGASSLTWFKLTEGDFMQLEDGAVFERQPEAPRTGSWWHGAIEPGT